MQGNTWEEEQELHLLYAQVMNYHHARPPIHAQQSQDAPGAVIVTSFWRRISSAWVHVFPVAVTGVLLYFNASGYYLGAHLPAAVWMEDDAKLDALQGAAKVHEIAIVTSMAAFVLYVVCYFLLRGLGLPLGLVGASFNFSQPTFLISSEYWGWVSKYDQTALWRFTAAFLVLLFCFVANSVGPASAILMIPKNQTWPTAHYDFFLNGTAKDLWPEKLELEHIGGDNCTDFRAAMQQPSCNAGGFPSLSQYFSTFTVYPQSHAFLFDTQDGLGKMNFEGNIRNGWSQGSETWTKAPHMSTLLVQEPIRQTWSLHLRDLKSKRDRRTDYSNIRTARVRCEIPAVRTACVPVANLSVNADASLSMAFPVLPEYDYWFWPAHMETDEDGTFGIGKVDYADVDVSSIIQNATDGDPGSLIVRTRWVPLPSSFGSVSAGLVVLFSRRDEKGSFTKFEWGMGCSADPRWTAGVNWLTTSRNDWAWAGFSRATQSTILNRRTPPNDYDGERFFLPIDDGSWRRIGLSEGWLNALTPEGPDRRTSTVGMVLEDQVSQLRKVENLDQYFAKDSADLVPFVEHVVSAILTDGITRVGTNIQPSVKLMNEIFRNTLPEDFSKGSPDVVIGLTPREVTTTPMKLNTEVQGFAYLPSGPADSFAVSVLFFHIWIVIVHVICLSFFKFNSSTLGTLSEFIILAFNSHARQGQTRLPLPSMAKRPQRRKVFAKDTIVTAVNNGQGGLQELQLSFQAARERGIEDDRGYI